MFLIKSVRNLAAALACLSLAATALFMVGYRVSAQEAPQANTNSNISPLQTPEPPPEPTPIPVAEIVTQRDKTRKRIKEIESQILAETPVVRIQKELDEFNSDLEEREQKTNRLLKSNPSLETLKKMENEWNGLALKPAFWNAALQSTARVRNKQKSELKKILKTWEDSLSRIDISPTEESADRVTDDNPKSAARETNSKQQNLASSASNTPLEGGSNEKKIDTPATEVPIEVKKSIGKTIADIKRVQDLAADRLTKILKLQSRVSETEKQIIDFLAKVKANHDEAMTNLFVKDSPAIWSTGSMAAGTEQQEDHSLSERLSDLNQFLISNQSRVIYHFIAIGLLVLILFGTRRGTRRLAAGEAELGGSLRVFEHPVPLGLLLGIMIDDFVYPKMPDLFDFFLNVVGVISMFFLAKQFIEKKHRTILFAVLALYAVDDLRFFAAAFPLASRLIYVLEMLGGICFLIWLYRSRRPGNNPSASSSGSDSVIRNASIFLLPVCSLALLADMFGYVKFAGLIGDALVSSLLFGLFLYVMVQFLDSLQILVFRVRPFSKLEMVKKHRHLIQQKLFTLLKWTAIVFWISITLSLLYLDQEAAAVLTGILGAGVTIGTLSISFGGILAFVLTILLSFWLSRFLRFALEEDVYPRLELADGLPYAASTILHYLVLLLGFFVAMAALGVDLTSFTILAGAFGVGLGFGLQNLVENFSSGLVLLFERPIKVGDLIEIKNLQGTLRRVGLRASIVRTVQGSEIIVPNGLLLSQEVTNWTLSDPLRRIDIEVGVEYGTKLGDVIELLEKVGDKHTDPKLDQPAQALFVGFGDSSLDFQLRVWTSNDDNWVALKSDLSIEVYEVLEEAGIEIPFPQQDLRVRSLDKEVLKSYSLPETNERKSENGD
jgi:small-conductance mechanosensitive channel